MNTSRKATTINIRIGKSEQNLIDRAAAMSGKNRSDFMLECSCREAETVLLDQKLFLLEETEFVKFRDQLNASAKPSPKLKALLESKSPWEK